jgi:hypothetical protein
MTGITEDSLIETIEGPAPIGRLAGKSMLVLTRLPNGQFGFRRMRVKKTGEQVPVVRVTLNNQQVVTVAAGHVFYKKGAQETVLAKDLQVGEKLEPSWVFPEGYVSPYRPDSSSEGCYRVVGIEPAGSADVFNGAVRETHWYYLTCGVLCQDGD